MAPICVALHVRHPEPELRRELKRRGFQILTCRAAEPDGCPVVRGERCPVAERADVIVCDGGDDGWRVPRLVEALRARYPGLPIVVAGRGLDSILLDALGEPWIATFVGPPTAARLTLVIDEAMGGTPEAMIGIVG
jgi:hypothetical protein